jgi:plasmid stabilization system protein ParE
MVDFAHNQPPPPTQGGDLAVWVYTDARVRAIAEGEPFDGDEGYTVVGGHIARVNSQVLEATETAARPEPAPTPTRWQEQVEAPTADGRAMLAEAADLAKAANHARARAARIALDPALADMPYGGRSKLARTPEYRKIEARRYAARKRGLDPNDLGPDYRLPTRTTLGRQRRPWGAGLIAERKALTALGLDPSLADDLED